MAQRVEAPMRRWPLVVALGVLLALGLLTLASIYYLDLLWFREVGFSEVFWGVLTGKAGLALVVGAIFFGLLYGNLLIVRRSAPRYRVLSPEQEMVERYRLAFEPYLRWLIPAFCLILAVMVGIGAMDQWRVATLFLNSGGLSFGVDDPVFGRDASYYVFSLPFWHLVQGWLFSMLIGVTLLTAVGHYLWGGIRPQAPSERVTPQVKAHLSVLIGFILLVRAWGFWLDRFDLLISPRGTVTGASYTDINAQLPALNFLIVACIVCAVLFFVNIRLRGWGLPVISVGLLVLVSLVIGVAFPAFVQKFRVDPQEFQQEQPFIERNIEFTRRAFALDGIRASQTQPEESLTAQDVADDATTVDNIRLWDPLLLQENYRQLQRIKQYYEFSDVDVDRYTLNGQRRLVMTSAREISQAGIPEQGATWQNRHLVYTHGFGAVASQVNGATEQGSPLFILQDIPPVGSAQEGSADLAADLNAGQPRVYFGERSDVPFVVTNSATPELDYQGTASNDTEQVTYDYEGSGGIPVGGLMNKLLFAWRFRDINLLISNLITDESRVMIYRSIYERVPKAAPFLQFDGDPYAAIVDGRIVWIWDAYTTTNRYPYSEEVDLAGATGGDLTGEANYIRNSVKVVVDAYDGSITYYLFDESDPIIQAWARAFPDLFTPLSEAPTELRAHFRYPENLFQVQAQQWANYHVTDPTVFYQKQDFWSVPVDPAAQANGAAANPAMRPYYALMRLPGEQTEEFVLIQPLTPQGRQNMIAWMAVRSDLADSYGDMISFEFPSGTNIDGPVQVFNQIQSDPRFSAEQTLLSQGGSDVLFGNLLVIPVGPSFLYVQPVFVQSDQENAFPELKRVVVVHGGSVGIGTTLSQALADAGLATQPGESGGPDDKGEKPDSGDSGVTTQELLDEALRRFERAEAALRAGDLATYQAEIERAQALIEQALAASAPGTGGQGEAPSPETSATPSVTSPSPPASASP